MSELYELVVCDDDEGRRADWQKGLEEIDAVGTSFEVRTFEGFDEALEALEERRRMARNGADIELSGTPFDEADVLLLDYDLFDYNGFVTGEIVAYLARCYSACGLIVSVNEFGRNPFDLTLRGHLDSFADVNIGDAQLFNPWLWGGTGGLFRPWAWPIVPVELDRWQRRLESAQSNLGRSPLEILGLPQEGLQALPRTAIERIERPGERRVPMSLGELVDDHRLGLRPGDKPAGDEGRARIAAARTARWIDTALLAPQDVLVDAPHLVARNPLLLRGELEDLSAWNTLTPLDNVPTTIEAERLLPHLVTADEWLSRRAWFGTTVAEDLDIPGVRDPASIPAAPFVFCEDVSCFLQRDAARQFVADVTGPYVIRYVAAPERGVLADASELQEVDYGPALRLAM